MVKLMVVFLIGLMLYAATAQEGGDEFQTGQVGETVIYGDCQNAELGKCSKNTKCCSPRICWIDGKCDNKVPSGFSPEGYEYVTGKAGEWQRYDACEDNKGRIGDQCSEESDCCFPLDCNSGICEGTSNIAAMLGALRGFGRA